MFTKQSFMTHRVRHPQSLLDYLRLGAAHTGPTEEGEACHRDALSCKHYLERVRGFDAVVTRFH